MPGDELLGYTWEILAKWVGRKTLRDALGLLEGGQDVEVIELAAVTIRFPGSSIECRYFPGAGLEGMVTTAPARNRERFLAAAVLAYQRRHGILHESDGPAPSVFQAALGAPRTRDEVLQSASSLLEEIVTVGMAHLSGSTRDRLQTLGVSCVGANLPRLALALKALSDEVALALRRDAQADDGRLFAMLARTYALCQALVSAGDAVSAALIGRHRSRYDETGTLELSGIGAYAWRTQSGFHGLTVLFWDPAARQWCSWSVSRPVARDPSFNPFAHYEQDLPWPGASSARRMSRSRFRLRGASRNDENRLSASEQCRAIVLGDVHPSAIDFGNWLFTDWTHLRRHLASVTPAGLEQHAPLERVVVVRPDVWGPRVFVPAQQKLVWPLFDPRGQPLVLVLPFDEINQEAIQALERIDPALDSPWAILGRISFRGIDLELWPYSLFRDRGPLETRIQNLNLDGVGDRDGLKPQSGGSAGFEGGSSEESPEFMTESFAAILKQWSGVEDELQRLAEAGARGLVPTAQARLTELASDLRNRGLALLGDNLEPLGDSRSAATTVLKTKYCCMLYRELAIRVLADVAAPEAPASPNPDPRLVSQNDSHPTTPTSSP
jgi:hypothetical protein